MHYLITGHTGFKGSWLTLMLTSLGHEVSGLALEPEAKSLFLEADVGQYLKNDLRVDIRDKVATARALREIEPDVVIHLAAQPLVRRSYANPIETFETNVLGTLNVLEATRGIEQLKCILVVTTDKVYKNKNQLTGYNELDPLGGDDPYSASKAAADIAAQSWVKSFGVVPTAIARAGNVVGGGDWAEDRIIPDLVRAYDQNRTPILRYPNAVRPWQHVLDCLNGYLVLIEALLVKTQSGGEWNFGPSLDETHTVNQVVNLFESAWGKKRDYFEVEAHVQNPESGLLLLDSSKAVSKLGWKEILSFEECIEWAADWYLNSTDSTLDKTKKQIEEFLLRARDITSKI